ncbi:transposase [Glycomyces rhizosphaerae]|uniref:Transposase n=1 Tax=Glycomyces rhizosphaerae TaxID=2054422 RepID=A0ABV7PUZ1_9ACTN
MRLRHRFRIYPSPTEADSLARAREVAEGSLPDNGRAVGLDLGPTSFTTDSNGGKVPAPQPLRAAERRLARAHRALARKRPGSANREKARSAVAAPHPAVSGTRTDRLSSKIISENQAVVVEDLCVKGLARTRPAECP